MGLLNWNDFSSNNALWIHTDKPGYHPGDVVKGVVCMNCVKPINSTRVKLKVKGVVKTMVEEQYEEVVRHANGKTTRKTKYRQHFGRHDFFKEEVPLCDADAYTPGQYQFMFALKLPSDLPSTMDWQWKYPKPRPHAWATIYYKVKAVCHTQGMFTKAIKERVPMLVLQKPNEPHPVCQVAEQAVKCCSCFRRGDCWASAEIRRDALAVGDRLRIRLQVDNRSKQTFKKVTVKLEQTAVIRGNSGFTGMFYSTYPLGQFEEVPAYEKFMGEMARIMGLKANKLMPIPTGGGMFKGGVVVPSLATALSNFSYKVVVKLKGGSMGSDVRLVFNPIMINAAKLPKPDKDFLTQAPPGWRPGQIYDPVEIQLPGAEEEGDDVLGPTADFWERVRQGNWRPEESEPSEPSEKGTEDEELDELGSWIGEGDASVDGSALEEAMQAEDAKAKAQAVLAGAAEAEAGAAAGLAAGRPGRAVHPMPPPSGAAPYVALTALQWQPGAQGPYAPPGAGPPFVHPQAPAPQQVPPGGPYPQGVTLGQGPQPGMMAPQQPQHQPAQAFAPAPLSRPSLGQLQPAQPFTAGSAQAAPPFTGAASAPQPMLAQLAPAPPVPAPPQYQRAQTFNPTSLPAPLSRPSHGLQLVQPGLAPQPVATQPLMLPQPVAAAAGYHQPQAIAGPTFASSAPGPKPQQLQPLAQPTPRVGPGPSTPTVGQAAAPSSPPAPLSQPAAGGSSFYRSMVAPQPGPGPF